MGFRARPFGVEAGDSRLAARDRQASEDFGRLILVRYARQGVLRAGRGRTWARHLGGRTQRRFHRIDDGHARAVGKVSRQSC